MMRVLIHCVLSSSVLVVSALSASADPLLFVGSATGWISKFTLDGVPLGRFTTSLGQTAGLAVNDQKLYAADYSNNLVLVFAADGTRLATLSSGAGPVGMAFDANGSLFVSNQIGGTIKKFAADGTDLGVFAAGLNMPWGLAFDAAGNLYVASRGANVIRRYAADGTSLGVFASGGLDEPIGIAFDALGNLYVANFHASTIRKFSSMGTDLGVFASAGVRAPTEIRFHEGMLYVANAADSTVRLFAADGTDLGPLVTAEISSPQGLAIMKDPDAVPDLEVSVLKGKTVAGAGAPYAAKDTTKNGGAADAPASETRFYLSTDATKDDGDTHLMPFQGRSVPPLLIGATSTGTTTVTIPPGTPSAKQFLIACADGPDAILESTEADNCKAKAIYVGPDLVISKVIAPASAIPGQTIPITDTTQNSGGAPTTAVTTTRLYLSLDKKLDGSDMPLGTGRGVPVLAAHGSSTATTEVTIPAGTALGVHYILAKADSGAEQVESRETNNIKATAITVN